MTVTFNPVFPLWGVALAGVALAAALVAGSRLLRTEKHLQRRWVLGLGLLRAVAIGLFLLALLRPQATWVREVRQGRDLIVLVDTSESMAIGGARPGGTRLRRAMGALTSGRFGSEYLARYRTRWYGFDSGAYASDPDVLARTAPAGRTTRFAEGIETAWALYRPEGTVAGGAPAARVLLVSDGHDRGSRDAAEAARQLGLIVDTIAPPEAAAEARPALVEVEGIQHPGRVLLGSEVRFLATVRREGPPASALVLTLAEDGRVVVRHEFTFAAGESERPVMLTSRPASAGVKRYAVRVAPKGPDPALRTGAPYEVSVRVEGKRNEVLVIEDAWRWEFKFLRRVLESDPSFSFSGFVAAGTGVYMQYGEPDRRANLAGLPQTRAELGAFDTVVIGDLDPGRWPRAFAPALYELVAEEGRSLVVIAGPRLPRMARVPEIAALLPVEVTPETGRPLDGPVDLRITPEGAASAVFYRPGGPAGRRWSDLPPVDQVYAPLRKRAAATILAEAVGRANDYGPVIVLAEQAVGRGRVLFVGTDALWKWQTAAAADADGNTPYTVFWQQALRALAPARLSAGAVSLSVQTDRTMYRSGQAVTVSAEARSDQPIERAAVEAAVTLPDGRALPLAMQRDAAQPGLFHAVFEPAAAGAYRVAATLTADGKPAAESMAVLQVRPLESERDDSGIRSATLAQVASGTGGRAIDPGEPGTWPAAPGADEQVVVRRARTVDLWGGFWIISALVAVLGLDWLIRLMRGYV